MKLRTATLAGATVLALVGITHAGGWTTMTIIPAAQEVPAPPVAAGWTAPAWCASASAQVRARNVSCSGGGAGG